MINIRKPYKHNKTPADFGIIKYKVNSDGSLNVFQDVELGNKKLKKLPFYFNKVGGYFSCSSNNFKTLEGAPKIIKNKFKHCNFFCAYNDLKTLKGIPNKIDSLFCSGNNLKTLDDLNFDGISGIIFAGKNPNLILSDKVKMWMDLNPGRLVLK